MEGGGVEGMFALGFNPSTFSCQSRLTTFKLHGVDWAYLGYSGFPIVMYWATKSAVAQN